ncbi:DNA gyrase inhibitor YacG [Roseovarius autotrophicus]|uniref:DNA gyrase inhibitor YacG n=1 Tax=Roseovarius autotrophicus TaxID=2824121 RepID=UPI0019E0F8A3|nr:DNA gyrase inhibitor YacG [Roseovarius autotrophicus]MBE0455348.1 DNA gyrase inhibitor YacG [Roseovarius sp.]
MTCPICGKPAEDRYRPFCSRRCADIDLGKWFTGDYAVPSRDPEDIAKAAEAAEKEAQKPH